jgi:general stress protein 26
MTKYFAKLDSDNKVIKISSVADSIATTEQAGIDFLNTHFKTNDVWVQSSKDGTIRKNSAVKGYTYDSGRDAFIAPKPYDNWVFDEDTCRWIIPVSRPEDGKGYRWNQETGTWVEQDKENPEDF